MDKPRITIRLNQPNDRLNQNQPNGQKVQERIEGTNQREDPITALEMEIKRADEIQRERERQHEEVIMPEIEMDEDLYRERFRNKRPKIISWFASSKDGKNTTKKRADHLSFRHKTIYRPKKHSSKKIREEFQLNQNIAKTIGVGLGAVATGILFGFILLHFFITPMMVGTDSIFTSTNGSRQSSKQVVVIPQKVVYLLQSGVFTDKSSAETAATEFKNGGKAGIVKEGSPNRVFVGIAPDKAQGQVLVELLKGEGYDTYLKPYTIKEYQANMSNETFQSFYSWINAGDQMVKWLASQSISLLKNPKATVNEKEIQKYHQQYLTQAQVVLEKLENEEKRNELQIAKSMMNQINYAMTAFTEFRKTKSPLYLWNVQDSLLKYVMTYETLDQK
ncbi:SPOR domain-containing protein [Tepidibacillus sp. LV47]|uniref:SPOR domain-containing protein n=1 Tax=Tepidibacillus sp. LV47 TaxID=3398228 RepID=UPI003AAD1B1E